MKEYDLVIIGAGPAGIKGAEKAKEFGIEKVAVLEKEMKGGVCLNWGCIPTKSLLYQAGIINNARKIEKFGGSVDLTAFDYGKLIASSRKTVNMLGKAVDLKFKNHDIDYIEGEFSFLQANEVISKNGEKIRAENFLLATGSKPFEIKGLEFDGKQIVSSKEALSLPEKPDRVVIIGSGAIGLELGWFWASLGSQVSVVELKKEIIPGEDRDSVKVLERELRRKKMKVYTDSKVVNVEKTEKDIKLKIEGKHNIFVESDLVLVAAGRRPDVESLALENIGLENNLIEVNSLYQTRFPWLYAAGDVIQGMRLAHLASYEAEQAVRAIAGKAPLKAKFVPRCLYTKPEIASFGAEERALKSKNLPFKSHTCSYRLSGRAVAEDAGEGIVKILFSDDYKEIKGVSIAGAQASELIHQYLLIAESNSLEDIQNIIFAHPSFSEIVYESLTACK